MSNQNKGGSTAPENKSNAPVMEIPAGNPAPQKEPVNGGMVVESSKGPLPVTPEQLQAIIAAVGSIIRDTTNTTATPAPVFTGVEQYRAEDHLPEPVAFFSIRSSYVDYGAKRGDGTYHLPPFVREDGLPDPKTGKLPVKPIEFKFSHSDIKIDIGKQTIEKLRFSTFVCQNKKELEYLMAHPLLGIEFFRATDKITSYDTLRARALADAHRDVDGMPNDVVIERLRSLGKQVTQDMGDNRNILMNTLADQRLMQEERTLSKNFAVVAADPKADPRELAVASGSQKHKMMAEVADSIRDSD